MEACLRSWALPLAGSSHRCPWGSLQRDVLKPELGPECSLAVELLINMLSGRNQTQKATAEELSF
jgi:hypothetical protein